MGKLAETKKQKSLRKTKISLKLLLLLLKKIREYIKEKNKNKDKDKTDEYPTIYISKKYPKMSILELYRIIKNHIKEYFPNIYNRIKSKRKEFLTKSPIFLYNDSNQVESLNDNKNGDDWFFINIYKGRELTEEIIDINERNCSHIKNLFESYKFEPNILKKYDKCFIQIVDCRKNGLDSHINNKKDNLSTESSILSSSNKNNKINKIHFVTHFLNNKRKAYNLFKINHL